MSERSYRSFGLAVLSGKSAWSRSRLSEEWCQWTGAWAAAACTSVSSCHDIQHVNHTIPLACALLYDQQWDGVCMDMCSVRLTVYKCWGGVSPHIHMLYYIDC